MTLPCKKSGDELAKVSKADDANGEAGVLGGGAGNGGRHGE